MDKNKKYNCFFEFTLDIVGGKWKPIILYYININSVARHSELKDLFHLSMKECLLDN